MFKAIKTGQINVDKNFDIVMRELEDLRALVTTLQATVTTQGKSLNIIGKNL